jgi:hypothetical protein
MEREKSPELLILTKAEGKIHAEHTPEIVRLAESIAQGEYHRQTNKNIICKCIDGRNCEDGLEGPNSAGGTLSLLVADDLTSQRFITTDETIEVGMRRLTTELTEQGQPVGVHADTNATGENSGCGANDKLPEIYGMMVKKAEHIRELTELILGAPVPRNIHDLIMSRAAERVLFSPGSSVESVVTKVAGDDASETLQGGHQEIVAVINKVTGTTLDRDELELATVGEYQAFNVDAWAFEASARAISEHDDDMIDAKVIALTYYNLATALVLCGPNMLVGIRE